MIDVHLPRTDGREVILTRYTQPDRDQELLLHQLKLTLPEQPPAEDSRYRCRSRCSSGTADCARVPSDPNPRTVRTPPSDFF
jgi:hypothetical protein